VTALVVMIGPPGSGKSTWCAGRFRPSQIVNLDHLRELVCDDPGDMSATGDAVQVQHRLIAARCRRRLLTVVDATNVRPGLRIGLLDHAAANGMLALAVVLDVPEDVCKARNKLRDRQVPVEVVDRMCEQRLDDLKVPGPVPGFAVTRWIDCHGRDLVFGWRDDLGGKPPWLG
jgi:protein phosphatase